MKLLKYLLISIGSIFFYAASHAQPLTSKAVEVKRAWETMQANPTSAQNELTYVNVFPDNKIDFLAVFEPANYKTQKYLNDPKYINSFIDLAKDYPEQVMGKALDIGKDLVWEADATGQLQEGIMNLSVIYPDLFIKKLRDLTGVQQNKLIKFLADKENHPAYPHYQRLIDILNQKKETGLANMLVEARAAREKEKE